MNYHLMAPGDRYVPWLAQCKNNWCFKPIKYSCVINKNTLSEDTDVNKEISYIDIGSVDSTGKWTSSEPMLFGEAPSRARRLVIDGDVLISTVRTYLGAIASIKKATENLVCSTGFAVIGAGENANSDFLAYWVRSNFFIGEIVSRSTGVSYPAINASDIGNLPFPVISTREQRAIATFLDRETERIDNLITRKQRQIELLQEKRSALIGSVVTKGLDPNVKMKDSGVEWLGEMPEHWEVTKLKYTGHIKYGLGEPPRSLDTGLPIIRATDISRGKVNMETVQRIDPDDVPWSRDPVLKLNDILVVRSGAYTGDSAIIEPEVAGAIAGYDMVLRVTKALPHFIAYALLSKYLLQGQIYLEKMRAAQPHLNAEELGNCIILIPPKDEQEEIVSFLNQVTDENDTLTMLLVKSINKLQEYRVALISAAVTGKIDVRGEQ